MKVVSRKEAKANGLKRYYTGNACLRGHKAERYTCNKTCVVCDRLRKAKSRNKVETKLVVEGKSVRVVKFLVVGNGGRFRGRKRFSPVVVEERVVNLA